MLKFVFGTVAAALFAVTASAQAPAPSAPAISAPPATPAPAAASTDTTPYFVNIVELEISPSSMSRFMADLDDDVKGTIQESGVAELNSAVGQQDKNHVFIFEVYNNSTAWDSHQKSATYMKFVGLTMMMLKSYNIRPFSSLAINKSSSAKPASGPLYIKVNEFDLAPEHYNDFVVAAKIEAAGAVQDPGVREFDIAAGTTTKNHVMLFEVYDNAAAAEAEMATDRYKTFQSSTKVWIGKGDSTVYSSVSMNAK
jgi:quinol monooxygenase YgiN